MKKYLNSPLYWVIIIALFTIALNFGGNCYAEDGDFKEIVTIHWSNNLVGSGTVDESYVSVPGASSVDGKGVSSGGVSFTAPSGYKIIGFVTGTKVHTMPLYYRLVYTGEGTVVNPGVYYPLPDNTTYFYFYHTNGAAYTLEVRNVVIYLEHTQNISGIGEAKAAAQAAAQAAAEASASASASAKTLNAPLITQFQVNGGALEKEGTGIVKAIFRAQNSPIDASWDKIQYRITRVDSTGIETELVNWTNFDEMLSSRGEADIQPIAGMNNLILYVKNTTSGAISKANTTLIAGTISDRIIALESYFGGMYRITKESRDYSGYAAIMADEAKEYALDAYSTVTNSTYGLSALKSLIDTVNGVADQAQAAAEKAEAKALNAYNAVETGTGIKTIDVLTDPTANKGLIQTYDKADTAATNASTAASRVWDAAEGKSAATLAKEARDKVNEVSRRAEIKSVKGKNGATCTTTNQFTVVITANNATSYRARVAGESTWYISTGGSGANTWGPGNEITVRNISGSGPITIQVAARYSNDVYETTDSITIFKIVQ